MRVAVALAGRTLEVAAFKAAHAVQPAASHGRLHARPTQLVDGGVQELERRVDSGQEQAASGSLGDAGQVGQLEATEDRYKVRVIDPLQAVALVEVGSLLRHPDRGRDSDRAGDALPHLLSERRFDRLGNSFRAQLL